MLPRSLWLQVCLMKHQRESQLSVWQREGATVTFDRSKAEGIEFSAKTHEWDELTGWK